MSTKNTIKPNFSVSKIGVRKFWIGIVVGVMFAFSICLFFNYSREILRFFSGASSDLILLEKKTALFFDIFFATLSTAIGFSVTFWIWMSGTKYEHQKQKLFSRLSQVNSTIIIWIPLMMITRIGSILFVILYAQRGYDSNLNLIKDYRILFLTLPLVVFFQNWISIRKVFKVKKWIIYSFASFLVFSLFIFLTSSIDNQIVDDSYSQRFLEEYEFIDTEVKRAKDDYDISFSSTTVKILKEWHTSSSIEQVNQVQHAFESKRNMTLDTIILQKIIVKNFKEGKWFYRNINSFDNWPYAKPVEIQQQIILNKTEPNKLIELQDLINEQVNLINYLDKEWIDYDELSQTERRKFIVANYRIPKVVVTQLMNVVNDLNKMIKEENLNIYINELNLLNEK